MKKLFTLALALMGFAATADAATLDDLAVLKHSYVMVCDELGSRPGKGVLFGNDHFLDVTGGSISTGKGMVDLSVADTLGPNKEPLYVTQEIVDKYGEDYKGQHYNWLRLKNAQDVIAMKLTAKSKIIMFLQGNNKTGKDARIPKISKNADLSDALNSAPGEDHAATVSGYRWDYTVADDGLYYIGSYNGDMFVSFIIIEANEAPGTPTIKVGDQKYEGGLWFREVTCKVNAAVEDGESIPTVVTYTTDDTAPTAASTLYTEPIKCYKDMTVKFQAFYDFDADGKMDEDAMIAEGADNEGNVNFSFNAPTISADGANVTITSEYEGAKNFYQLNDGEATEGSNVTLTESATVTAYSEIVNGEYTTFTTKSSTSDVYVLNPIKEAKTITVTGDAVVDDEATAASTDGTTVYKVENGAITADKADFFVKNLTFAVLKDAKAQYQVPEGQEVYIQMSNTNITFEVAEGDSVNVKVICSKNSCKNIDETDEDVNAEGSKVADNRKCFVNVDGTNYGGEDLKLNPDGNVITFGLSAGIHTFKKYSGTGNILISSIEITPASAEPTETDLELTEGHTLLISTIEAAGGTDEDIVRFYITNTSADSREGWGIGGFANSDNWTPIVEWTGMAGTEWYYDYTVAKIKEVAGTTAGEWHDVGITINIYNDCKVAKATLIKDGSTGIENVMIDNNIKTGVRYNLSGQKVDDTYKGIIIMNGKKMIQK